MGFDGEPRGDGRLLCRRSPRYRLGILLVVGLLTRPVRARSVPVPGQSLDIRVGLRPWIWELLVPVLCIAWAGGGTRRQSLGNRCVAGAAAGRPPYGGEFEERLNASVGGDSHAQ